VERLLTLHGHWHIEPERWSGVGSEVPICKRCGKPIYRYEYRKKGNRVYVYAEHREVLPDGKVKFYYHYLGPADKYKYVSELHEDIFPQGLKGAYYDIEVGPRRVDYLRDQVKAIKNQMQRHELPAREALELVGAIEELYALVGELRQYAEVKAKEEREQAQEQESEPQ
jgi:hypothetical protein